MNKYYIEFKTWKEGTVEMPGSHRVLGEVNDYRNRKNLTVKIPHSTVQSIFYSFSEEAIKKFLLDHICACHVALLTDGNSEDEVIDLIERHLGPIELIGISQISNENKQLIEKIMGDI